MNKCNCSNKNIYNKYSTNQYIYSTINNYQTHDVIDSATYIIIRENYYDNYYIRYNHYYIDDYHNIYKHKTQSVYEGTKYKTHETIYKR